MLPPPPRPKMLKIQPNETFNNEAEMQAWLRINIPGAIVTHRWNLIACEVMAPIAKHNIQERKRKK